MFWFSLVVRMLLSDPGVTDTADIRNLTQIYSTWLKRTLSLIHVWIFLKQLVLSLMYHVLIISTCWCCKKQHKLKLTKELLVQRAYVGEQCISRATALGNSMSLMLHLSPWGITTVFRRHGPHTSCNVSPLFLLIGPHLLILLCAENWK